MPLSQEVENTAEETEELVKFRELWKREVQQKKAQTGAGSQLHPSTSEWTGDLPTSSRDTQGIAASSASASSKNIARHARPHSHSNATVPAEHHTPPERRALPDAVFSDALRAAIDVYARAIQCEQESQLDEALQLYRRAFRMNANVDRAYHLMEKLNTALRNRQHSSASHEAAVEDINHGIRSVALGDIAHAHAANVHPSSVSTLPLNRSTVRLLVNLISGWPQPLAFQPEDETEPVHIERLPDELLVLILRWLAPSSVERFAVTARKARVLSLDGAIWRSDILF